MSRFWGSFRKPHYSVTCWEPRVGKVLTCNLPWFPCSLLYQSSYHCKTPLIADIQLNSELMGEIERGRLYVILTHPGCHHGYLMEWSSWHHTWLGSLILLPHAPKSTYSLVFCKDNRQIGKENDVLVLQIQVPFKCWWHVPSQTWQTLTWFILPLEPTKLIKWN